MVLETESGTRPAHVKKIENQMVDSSGGRFTLSMRSRKEDIRICGGLSSAYAHHTRSHGQRRTES